MERKRVEGRTDQVRWDLIKEDAHWHEWNMNRCGDLDRSKRGNKSLWLVTVETN
jgi:hypothetical protein